MTSEQRLAQLVGELETAGIDALVMGGHAVRYYGVDRNTIDFDFVTAAVSVADLGDRIAGSPFFAHATQGPSWRPHDFTRFQIGALPDGREEWVEFWLHNHLLPPFEVLRGRSERGAYGGREIAFLSLPDLLRSKETARESDWTDIGFLEEVQDVRNLERGDIGAFLLSVRTRRGVERGTTINAFNDLNSVRVAASKCDHPVTFAILAPLVPNLELPPTLRAPIDPAILAGLRASEFAGRRHVSLLEVVRRAYKRHAMDVDRADKQARLNRRDGA
jgi:hypothetical protein